MTQVTESIDGMAFLHLGGDTQRRYESLRSHWVAPDSRGLLAILRMPWGRRLFHFGILGLLDQDPTGGGWFEVALQDPPTSAAAVAGPRCARMLLAAIDGESRLRAAYQWLLVPSAALPQAAEKG